MVKSRGGKSFLPPVNLLISKKSLSMGQKNIMKGKISSETLEGIGQKRGHPVDENMEEHLDIVMNDSVTNLGLNYKRRSVIHGSEMRLVEKIINSEENLNNHFAVVAQQPPPGIMSLLCWNSRGLGDPRDLSRFRLAIRKLSPTFVFVSETKLYGNRISSLRKSMGFLHVFGVDSRGSKGG